MGSWCSTPLNWRFHVCSSCPGKPTEEKTNKDKITHLKLIQFANSKQHRLNVSKPWYPWIVWVSMNNRSNYRNYVHWINWSSLCAWKWEKVAGCCLKQAPIWEEWSLNLADDGFKARLTFLFHWNKRTKRYCKLKLCWNTSAGVITAWSTGQTGLDGDELSLKYKAV